MITEESLLIEGMLPFSVRDGGVEKRVTQLRQHTWASSRPLYVHATTTRKGLERWSEPQFYRFLDDHGIGWKTRLSEGSYREFSALDDIRLALVELDQLREKPSGTLRINAPGPAVDHVLCPLAFAFMEAHPDVKVEIVSDAAIIDIVEQGFDAGVRFGQQLAPDMIAVPLGQPLRYAIVASPDYLSSRGWPQTPSDLLNHNCIRRRYPGGTLATWAFEKAGETVEIAPEGRLTLSSAHQELQAALAGQGIAHVFDEYAQTAIDDGKLVDLLTDWSPKLPSWFLYYPNKRHNSAAMRAFLEFVRRSTR